MKKEVIKKREKLDKMFKPFSDNIHVYGKENIPEDGNTIFLINHNCFLDIYLIAYILNRPCISMVSANSLFGSNEERKKKLKGLLFPFPAETRAKKHYTDVCLNGMIKLFQNDKDLIVFPQGVFDEEGKISKARTGTIRILFEALDSEIKNYHLVPIALDVSNISQENIQSSDVWDNFEANITILQEIDYMSYYDKYKKADALAEKNKLLHNLMDTIMKDIADILKRDYVDKYKELYHMDGFWFPNGEFVLFEDSQDEKLYKKYKEMIFSLVDDYLKM